jgi:hypothetical protein
MTCGALIARRSHNKFVKTHPHPSRARLPRPKYPHPALQRLTLVYVRFLHVPNMYLYAAYSPFRQDQTSNL